MKNYSIKKENSIESCYVNEAYNLRITHETKQRKLEHTDINIDILECDVEKLARQFVNDLAEADQKLQKARLYIEDLLNACVQVKALSQGDADKIISSFYDKVVDEKPKSK